MPTHASRLTRAGSSRSLSSSPASPLGGTGATDSVVTVHVTPRVEVLEDFSLFSESASILSSSSELSRDNRTDPYRCGAVRSPPPLVRDLGAIVTSQEYYDVCASLGSLVEVSFSETKRLMASWVCMRRAGGRRGRQRLLVTRPSPQLLKLNVPASLPALRPTCQRPHESSCGSARVALGYWAP
jgi:hypothetical protein